MDGLGRHLNTFIRHPGEGRDPDTQPCDLVSALRECFDEPGPYLLNVKVSPYENVYPMVPAGGAISEMVLGQPKPVAVG